MSHNTSGLQSNAPVLELIWSSVSGQGISLSNRGNHGCSKTHDASLNIMNN